LEEVSIVWEKMARSPAYIISEMMISCDPYLFCIHIQYIYVLVLIGLTENMEHTIGLHQSYPGNLKTRKIINAYFFPL